MAVDVVVVDDSCRDLSFGDGLYDLRAFLVHLRASVGFEPFEELFRPLVSEGRFDDRHACLQILAAGVGNGDFILPLRLGKVEQRLNLIGFHQGRVVDDNPESTGEADPAVVGCAELGRNGSLDFAHIHGAQQFELSCMFEAAGIICQEDIGRGAVAFRLQPVDQLGGAGGQKLDLNAAFRLELVKNRFDQPFGATRIDDQFFGGEGGQVR